MKNYTFLLRLILIISIFTVGSETVLGSNINNKNHSYKRSPFGNPNMIQFTLNKYFYGVGYSNVDGSVVVFDSSFKKGIGPEDSRKLFNGGENIYFYVGSEYLSIDGLPNPKGGDSIFLYINQVTNDSLYKFKVDATQFTNIDTTIQGFILDKFTGKSTQLNVDSNIIYFTALTANAATYQQRFVVYFNLKPITDIIYLNGCNQYIYKGKTYTTSTIVRDTLKTYYGSDSIYNVANITISHLVAVTNNVSYAACNNFVYKGITYTSSTIVRDTVRSTQGCDSIYNIANIVITPIVAVTKNIPYSACNSIIYKGITYTSSIIVTDTVKSIQGCDSVYNVANIVITPIIAVTKAVPYNACNSIVYKGITYTSSTIVRDTVRSTQGCDSIYNIANIVITPIVAVTKNIPYSACNSIIYKGITYTSSIIVTDTVKSIQGCDSVYNVANIVITPIVAVTKNIPYSACNSIIYKGITYTSSIIVTDTVKSIQGCDSIYNVANIVITPIIVVTKTISYNACNNIIYKGITYTSSTIVRDTVRSVQGCDSVYNVANIVITPIVAITKNIPYSACNSIVYKGITYTSSTIVRDTVRSVQGCDSVYNVAYLVVTKIIASTNPTTFSGCNSVVYKGITYTNSTIVKDTVRSILGCDSIYNVATITVNTPNIPSVLLSSSSIVANGSLVIFTATPTYGGISPTYIFMVNSAVVQSGTSGTYTSTTLKAGDSVTCSMVSNANCITTTSAVSLPVIMTTNVPLTLLSFQAYLAATNTNCTWQTTTEVNSAYFIVQRSTDGNSFKDIGTINAIGNVTDISTYNYTDSNVTKLKNEPTLYYRLQMFDKNGHFTYSKVINVDLSLNVEFNIYPNPAKNFVNITGQNISTIKITDLNGKILILKKNINSNNSTINLEGLSKGLYIVNITSLTGNKLSGKLLIE